ncbi:CCA tRNA nucleotidyltransferase [Clostridium sp. ASF356]|nr:CCA tRNA nucleotidyltransferase [Clostridium sp. MD294]
MVLYRINHKKRNENMNLNIPKKIEKMLQKINSAGYEAYIVGGCVRDCFLKRQPQDWDITTSAEPEQIKKIFNRTYDTGLQHGTVTVSWEGEHYEVTTYRIEGKYDDCRHPNTVIFTKNLKEDLQRRDFTINAIAYHPQQGIKDYFLGQKHIEQKIIKGVGNAEERFQEDALRMLRALRFSAQLGFEIEQSTYQALQQKKELIKKISVERIHDELEKMLLSEYLEKINLLWKSGLLNEISPIVSNNMEQYGEEIIKQMKKAPFDRIIRWTIFLQYVEIKQGETFLKYLKFDNYTIKTVVMLLKHLKDDIALEEYELRKKANEMTVEQLKRLLLIHNIQQKQNIEQLQQYFDKILQRGDCITLKTLAVTGEDLIKEGMKKGKEIGEMLYFLLDIVHRNPEKNTKEILLYCAKEK